MPRHIIKIYGRNNFSTLCLLSSTTGCALCSRCFAAQCESRTHKIATHRLGPIMPPQKSHKLLCASSSKQHTQFSRCLEITCTGEPIICNWLSANYIYCLLALLGSECGEFIMFDRILQQQLQQWRKGELSLPGNSRFFFVVIDRENQLRCLAVFLRRTHNLT